MLFLIEVFVESSINFSQIENSEFLIIGDEVGNPLNEPIKTVEDTHVRFNKITNTFIFQNILSLSRKNEFILLFRIRRFN